jgi:hypothetical protein
MFDVFYVYSAFFERPMQVANDDQEDEGTKFMVKSRDILKRMTLATNSKTFLD